MINRCSRCLMPDNYPDITFDDNGVCNHCLNYRKPELLGEANFLQKIHSKYGSEFDCLIGISGGKDSCYAAYLAKKKYGLKTLAVTYDFPFMVELARKNSKAVCESLGIELVVIRSRNNLEYGLLRNHLISLAPTGTTWGQCMFCHYGIEAILYQTAQSKKIPFILSGVTSNEIWWNPGNRLSFLANKVKALTITEKTLFAYYQFRAYINLVDQRRQFPIPGNSCFNVYKRASTPLNGPETVPVFDYLEWDQDTIEKTLQEETGWQKPPRSLSWRYDCILEPLLDFTFKKELGISSAGLYLCALIRAGDITREEALNLLNANEDQERLNTSLKTVLDFLDVPAHIQQKYLVPSGK